MFSPSCGTNWLREFYLLSSQVVAKLRLKIKPTSEPLVSGNLTTSRFALQCFRVNAAAKELDGLACSYRQLIILLLCARRKRNWSSFAGQRLCRAGLSAITLPTVFGQCFGCQGFNSFQDYSVQDHPAPSVLLIQR